MRLVFCLRLLVEKRRLMGLFFLRRTTEAAVVMVDARRRSVLFKWRRLRLSGGHCCTKDPVFVHGRNLRHLNSTLLLLASTMTTAASVVLRKKNKPIKRRFSTKSRKQKTKRNPISYTTANPKPSSGRPRSACIRCVEKKILCSKYPGTTSCKP